MKIDTINATFQPGKIGTPHGTLTCCLVVSKSYSTVCVFVLFQDAYARGEVFIGNKDHSYSVLPILPPSVQGYHWQFGITIVTPDRKFLVTCETEKDREDWIAAFQIVLNRPMLLQEYAVEAYFKHKP
uniref:ArfGAP with dual PH domains 1 n=1 Tax=Nothobranchius kuhntae TaxID=321403 RepID=A0A1A8JAK1_NOTKU